MLIFKFRVLLKTLLYTRLHSMVTPPSSISCCEKEPKCASAVKITVLNKFFIGFCFKIDLLGSKESTALMRAAERGHLDIVIQLLASKASVNLCNSDGNTALHLAAQEGHPEVVKMLLKVQNGAYRWWIVKLDSF